MLLTHARPSSCSVDYDRDCGTKGCSISAIANYTTRVQSSSLSDQEVNYALRFLVHFIGDITQPLHDEAYEVGGNDVDVTFDSTDTVSTILLQVRHDSLTM